jgi:hypothetical protein
MDVCHADAVLRLTSVQGKIIITTTTTTTTTTLHPCVLTLD